jgi:4-azaleucine resistance transporter AzlC
VNPAVTQASRPHEAEYSRSREFLAGTRDTIPLVIGAIPFGVIFGASAVNSGISPLGVIGMSLFVFAGSAQFIAAQLVANHVGLVIIVVTTFIINLRHALYSTTLAPYAKHLSQRWLLPLGFWLTDETFVVVIGRYGKDDSSPYKQWYWFGSAIFMYVNWQLCTLIGLIAGQTIPDMRDWGLDFALIVTFIGMVIPMLKNNPLLLSAITAGLSAVLLNGLPNKMSLIIAALLGVAVGVVTEAIAPPKQEQNSVALKITFEPEQDSHE